MPTGWALFPSHHPAFRLPRLPADLLRANCWNERTRTECLTNCWNERTRTDESPFMAYPIVPAFAQFPNEAAIIGDLLGGYSQLEIDLMHCVHMVRG